MTRSGHEWDLAIAFFKVALIDAYSVDPQRAYIIEIAECAES
jgi:hypothetical protein